MGRAPKNDLRQADTQPKASITIVTDTTDANKWRNYYKLADGLVLGEDSVYASDAIFDCESDGKIRFDDRVTDKIGFFDNNGRIVEPAVYNDASRFKTVWLW